MLTYRVPMVPGPTSVPASVLAAYQTNFGDPNVEDEYFELYARTEQQLQQIMHTKNRVAIMSGEGMLVLWAALKSSLLPGDRVLAVATGLFGHGVGEMANSLGAEVRTVAFPANAVAEPGPIEEAIREFNPKMVTLIHCETPSGTLNPAAAVGELVARYEVPLYYVDAVSSLAGEEVLIDDWHIDFCLGGAQKCLSAPAGMSFLSVSPRAWDIVTAVGYQGYDALAPWQHALEARYFPYTPYWHGTAALSEACRLVLDEGLEQVIARHAAVARSCRDGVRRLGLQLFPEQEEWNSNTISAVAVPEGRTWEELDAALRKQGVVVGGNYGDLVGKVFRIGHMGSQAQPQLVEETLSALAVALG